MRLIKDICKAVFTLIQFVRDISVHWIKNRQAFLLTSACDTIASQGSHIALQVC